MPGAAATVEIRVLGALAVIGPGGASLPLGGARQRALLALLALRPNSVVSVDRLVDELWDGQPPATAVVTLQGYISRLRKALRDLPLEIVTRGPGYGLEVDADAIDARRFERLLASASAASNRPVEAASLLREALALWRGPALSDFTYASFAEAEIARLGELRLAALEQRIEADLELGLGAELVAELEALVAEHPLREGFRAQLMRALHGSGRRAEALRVYQGGRKILGEELGIEPSVALQTLEHAILMQDRSVEPADRRTSETLPDGPVRPGLPVQMTSFLGRRHELAEVSRLLSQHRLVSLVGPGGNGKTRLALRLAETTAGRFDDGVAMVELAGVTEPSFVTTTAASALGVQAEGDQPVMEAVRAAIGDRELLLVLDNCEHLVDACAAFVSAALAACPGLRILTTSREALGLAGEVTSTVPPLPVPPTTCTTLFEVLAHDAALLFVERGTSAFAPFSPTDADAGHIGHLCRRLDGVPLALELAAARLPVLSLEQIVARLDDRFALLTGGSRSVPERQRSLRATIEWSFDLLTPEEQRLFGRLSVFAGTFSLEAAESVCSGDGLAPADVLDQLTGLLQKSLVARAGATAGQARYRLNETLREFAAEQVGEGAAELRARHAAAFVITTEEAAPGLDGADHRRSIDRLAADHDDIRAALDWLVETGDAEGALRLAAALWRFWDHRYEVVEGRAWIGRALALPGGSPAARVGALAGAAHIALAAEELDEAVTWAETGLELADPDDHRRDRAELALTLGEVLRHRGTDPSRADELCAEAARLFDLAGDTRGGTQANRLLALLAWDRGELAVAAERGEACRALAEAAGDLESSAGAHLTLGAIARDQGALERATELCRASLRRFEQLGEPWGTAQVVVNLALLAVDASDPEAGTRLGEEALRLFRELGNRRGEAQSLQALAAAALAGEDLARAGSLVSEAIELFRAQDYPADLVVALPLGSEVAQRRGELDAAAGLAAEAVELSRASGSRRGAATALAQLASVRAAEGRTDDAVDLYGEALDVYREAGHERGMARTQEALADLGVVDLRDPRARGKVAGTRPRRQTRVETS